jgi:hypothetical protein
MKILDDIVADGIRCGTVTQMILADDEGFVIENHGTTFDPEVLVVALSESRKALRKLQNTIESGTISELSVRLDEEKLIASCRWFSTSEGGFAVIVVVPDGCGYRVLATRAVQELRRAAAKAG